MPGHVVALALPMGLTWLIAFASALIGALLALPALRVTGPYLAMVTLAFGTRLPNWSTTRTDGATATFRGARTAPRGRHGPHLLGPATIVTCL